MGLSCHVASIFTKSHNNIDHDTFVTCIIDILISFPIEYASAIGPTMAIPLQCKSIDKSKLLINFEFLNYLKWKH